MKSYQKYFSAGLLALLCQAAFADNAPTPTLRSASGFAVLSVSTATSTTAVTTTDSTVIGNVGSAGAVTLTDTRITGDVVKTGALTNTRSVITGATQTPLPAQVVTDFNAAYAAVKALACNTTSANTTFPPTLNPGVTCFTAGVTETNDTLTLLGNASSKWIIRIGNGGTGALTGTNFTVVLPTKVVLPAGASACNVTWWVAEAATITANAGVPAFKGIILAGAGITMTGTSTAQRLPFTGRALAKAAVTLTNVALVGCPAQPNDDDDDDDGKHKDKCNQGVGNGPEKCDPGNSNQGDASRSNDERGGIPGFPGRKGGNG